jgi:hypothetical protein
MVNTLFTFRYANASLAAFAAWVALDAIARVIQMTETGERTEER